MEDSAFTERPHPPDAVRFQLLGPLRVWREGVDLDIGPRQQGYLLALLLARAGRPTSMSELVDLLWGEDVPMSAINIVQKYVGAIRRLLEPDLATREAGSFIFRRGSGYTFDARPGAVDLVEFRSHVEAAKTHLTFGRPGESFDAYVQALGLWHGPAADGLSHSTTAYPLFSGINEEFFNACLAAAKLAETHGQSDHVIQPLRLAAWMTPLDEPVQASLIAALAAAGKQAEALSVYETVRARLVDDLGVTPGEALEAARSRVLRQARLRADASDRNTVDLAPGDTTNSSRSASNGTDLGGAETILAGSDRHGSNGANASEADSRTGVLVPSHASVDLAIIGRNDELGMLHRALDSVAAGHPALVTAEGEPGAGKTSLLEQFAQDAERRGALVAWGRCLNHEGTPALWPWTRLISELLATQSDSVRAGLGSGEIERLLDPRPDSILGGAVLPDSGAQFRLFEQVVDLLRQASAGRALVLVLDDLHWADLASLQLFRHVATQQPDRVVLVGLLRDRAPTPGDGLREVLAAVGRLPHHQRVRLGPLQPTEVGELVRRETGQEPSPYTARCIQARTEGNPFFVRELARLLTEGGGLDAAVSEDALARTGVPSTVRDIVRDRLATLDYDTRTLVEIAALLGQEVDLRLLARAADVEVTTAMTLLGPAEALGLLKPVENQPFSVRFVHDLVRESVQLTTSQLPRTNELHLQIADALAGTYGDDEAFTERLAHHLWLAGPLADPKRTTTALVRAGRRAVVQSAFDSAVPCLESAARLARSAGLLELELSALSQLVAVIGMQSGYMGDAEPTSALLERAERAARQLGREREAADFLFSHWAAHSQAIQLHRSGQLARRLLTEGERSVDAVVKAYGRHAWGIHQWDVGNIGEAYRYLSESYAVVAERSKSRDDEPLRHDLQLLSPAMLALNTALHGKVDEARAMLDRIEHDAGNHSYDVTVWSAFAVTTAALTGDPAWALRAADRGIAADPEHAFAFLGTYERLGWCWARAVTGQDAVQATAEAEDLIATNLAGPARSGLTTWLALLAEMYLASGRPHDAAEALLRADASIEVYGQRYASAFVRLMHAKTRLALGDEPDVAAGFAARAREEATTQEAYLFVQRSDEFLTHGGDGSSARRNLSDQAGAAELA